MPFDPQRARSIFLAALERGAGERWAFVEEACGGDAELRQRIDRLLQAHERPETPPEAAPAPGPTVDSAPPEGFGEAGGGPAEESGTVIGPYKLLQPIGEGGMGAVFMAEQTQPVRRRVALKVIKAGLDSKQVLARFEAERQALALMDHPNIAKVLDAGATPAGRPYFVMELIKGVPITRHCDERRLTPRQRLGLFVPVCRAVQHAHQKGIIHRDLKPSNVLVALYDDRAAPKVIDFGIAKATGPQLTERTLHTGFGAVVGTLEYMSPEQAELNQLDIDTRSDVYSLGVLLYELLTGTTPLERRRLRGAGLLEVLRTIREEEPPRPSTRLSTTEELPAIAADRGTEPRKLSGLVRGELDWIVMKALEKDRNRRYESAAALAADVQRYLADEPVQASPPSAAYRLGKFARRNKAALATSGVVAAALVLGLAASLWQAGRAINAEHLAENRLESERTAWNAESQSRDALEAERAHVNGQLNDVLAEAAGLRKQAQAARPGDKEFVGRLGEMAHRVEALAGHDLADRDLAQRVRALLAELRQEEADRRMVARVEEIRLNKGKYEGGRLVVYAGGAWPVYEAALREYGIPVADLAPEEAARRIAASPIRDWLVAALDDAAGTTELEGWLLPIARRAASTPWLREYFDARLRNDSFALERLARRPDALDQPPAALVGLVDALAPVASVAGRRNPFRPVMIELLRSARTRYPGDWWIHYKLGQWLRNTAPGAISGEERARRREEIRGCWRAALASRPEDAHLLNAVGFSLLDEGRYDEAAACYREAVRVNPQDGGACFGLSNALRRKGEAKEGIELLRGFVERNPSDRSGYRSFGYAVLQADGDTLWDDAAAYRKALETYPRGVPALLGLAGALETKGDLPAALATFEKAAGLDPRSAEAQRGLGHVLQRKGDWDGAVAAYRRAAALDPQSAPAYEDLARACWARKDPDGAVEAYRRLAELFPSYTTSLADALAARGDRDAAVAALRAALDRKPDLNCARKLVQLAQGDGAAGAAAAAAAAALRKLVAARPDSAEPYAELALALLAGGDRDGAFAAFRSAAERMRPFPDPYSRFAQALAARGDRDGVVEVYRVRVERLPTEQAHAELAEALRSRGDLDGAVAVYRDAIDRHPRYRWPGAGWAYRGLGRALLHRQGDAAPDDLAAARQALEAYPESPLAHACLAEALQKKSDLPGALEEFRKAAALDPRSAPLQTALAGVLEARGDQDGALAAWRKATELDPPSPEAFAGLARALRAGGDLDGAAAAYRRATELDPESPTGYVGLAEALQARGDLDGALDVYRGAAEFMPGYVGAYLGWARVLMARGDFDGAAGVYRRALERWSDTESNSYESTCKGLYAGLSAALQAKGDRKAADAVYRRAADLNPTASWPYTAWAEALQARGDREGALAVHRLAAERNPEDPLRRLGLAWALLDADDLDGGIAEYRRAVALKPNDPSSAAYYGGMGRHLRGKGAYAEAIDAFSRAVESDPKNLPYIRNELAWLLATCPDAKLRDPARAVEEARKALEGVPNGVAHPYFTTLGAAYYRLGDEKAAVAALKRVQANDDPAAWLFLALCHAKLGDPDGARKWYDRAAAWLEKQGPALEKKDPQRLGDLRRFRGEAEEALELKK